MRLIEKQELERQGIFAEPFLDLSQRRQRQAEGEDETLPRRVGILLARFSVDGSPFLTATGWFFVAGTILFSGSLYALSLSGQRWLGAITPLGGVAFLVGWIALAVAATGVTRP